MVTEEVSQGRRDPGGVPGPAPLPAARRARPRAVRRGADDRAVGRPRDDEQLVPRRAWSTTTATPSAAATCSPRAAGGPGRSTSRSPVRRLVDRGGDGFASPRIYRRVPRGAHLDVFCLDMRSYRGPTARRPGRGQPGILGPEQERWLIDEVSRSRATWKVISADLPLSIPSNWAGRPRRPVQRRPRRAHWARAGDRPGAVGVQAQRRAQRRLDHRRRPLHGGPPLRTRRARRTPTSTRSGSSCPARSPPRRSRARTRSSTAPSAPRWCSPRATTPAAAQSPRDGNQFFGHIAIAKDGLLTVTLLRRQRRRPVDDATSSRSRSRLRSPVPSR